MGSVIRCVTYDRVSTDNQVEFGISLDAQKKALTDYAVAHGYKLVGAYTDEGITARKKMQNRKELMRLLEDVKADKIDLILVTKLDRWFRNIKDYHNTQAILEAHNCNWKTIYEEYDTSTSNGRFAINIMLSVNENECDRDSDRIKETQRYKISIGEITSPSLINYGYKVENKHLVIDEDKRSIVEDVYSMFLQNHSKHTTYIRCTEKYGDIFSYQTFKHFFNSEIYTGKYKFNSSFCPAYLSPSEWDEIQRVNARNIRICEGKTKKGAYLFTGLIKCPHCGRNMAGGFVSGDKVYKFYNCWKFKVDRTCDFNQSISELKVEKYLKQNILIELERERHRITAREPKPDKPAIDINKSRKELERLNKMYLKGRISETQYDADYERLQKIISKSTTVTPPQIYHLERLNQVETILNDNWLAMYDDLDAENRRSFWHNIIDHIELTEEKTIRSISFY